MHFGAAGKHAMDQEDDAGVRVEAGAVEDQISELLAKLRDALDGVAGYQVCEDVHVLRTVLVQRLLRSVRYRARLPDSRLLS